MAVRVSSSDFIGGSGSVAECWMVRSGWSVKEVGVGVWRQKGAGTKGMTVAFFGAGLVCRLRCSSSSRVVLAVLGFWGKVVCQRL